MNWNPPSAPSLPSPGDVVDAVVEVVETTTEAVAGGCSDGAQDAVDGASEVANTLIELTVNVATEVSSTVIAGTERSIVRAADAVALIAASVLPVVIAAGRGALGTAPALTAAIKGTIAIGRYVVDSELNKALHTVQELQQEVGRVDAAIGHLLQEIRRIQTREQSAKDSIQRGEAERRQILDNLAKAAESLGMLMRAVSRRGQDSSASDSGSGSGAATTSQIHRLEFCLERIAVAHGLRGQPTLGKARALASLRRLQGQLPRTGKGLLGAAVAVGKPLAIPRVWPPVR